MKTLLIAAAVFVALSGAGSRDLFSDFEAGWGSVWMEHALAPKANAFDLDNEGENRFLRVHSMGSASALWRKVEVPTVDSPTLSWRWRVEMSLDHIEDERRRRSDDYAARVGVMFDGEAFERDTRALMYVWSGREDVGSVYPSPFSKNIATIVVRSGDSRKGDWLEERRDVRLDYERFFGEAPAKITAVALIVDTDNTDSETTAWFDDLSLVAPDPRY